MTGKSNAYIAQGLRDGEHVMKVGKSNNIARRQSEIGINIERIEQCISESAAYQFENDLRRFVIQQGGVRYKNTVSFRRAYLHTFAQIFQQTTVTAYRTI